MDPKLNTAATGGEGVLANFFNSLLNKKTGSPGSPGTVQSTSPRSMNGIPDAQEKNTMRTDAAAELDRLSRTVKKEIDFTQTDCWTVYYNACDLFKKRKMSFKSFVYS